MLSPGSMKGEFIRIPFLFLLLLPSLAFTNPEEVFKKAHEFYFYAQDALEQGDREKGKYFIDRAFEGYLAFVRRYLRNPRSAEALFRLGMIYRERKEYSRMFEAWVLLNFLFPNSEEAKKTSFFVLTRTSFPKEISSSLFFTMDSEDNLYVFSRERKVIYRYNLWAELRDRVVLQYSPYTSWIVNIAVLKDFIVGLNPGRLVIFSRKGKYLGNFSYPYPDVDISFKNIHPEDGVLVVDYFRKKKSRKFEYTPYRMKIKLPEGEIIQDEKASPKFWNSNFSSYCNLRGEMFFHISRRKERRIRCFLQDRWGIIWEEIPSAFYFFPSLYTFSRRELLMGSILFLTSRGNILGENIKYVFSLFPPPLLVYYFYGEKRFHSSILKKTIYLRIPLPEWREYIKGLRELKGNPSRGIKRLKRLTSTPDGERFLFPLALILMEKGEEREGEEILLRLSQKGNTLVTRDATEYLMRFYEKKGRLKEAFSQGERLKELYKVSSSDYLDAVSFLWTFQERHSYFPYAEEKPLPHPPRIVSLEKKFKIVSRPRSIFDTLAIEGDKIYLALREGRIEVWDREGKKLEEFPTGILPYSLDVEGEDIALRGKESDGREVIVIFRKGKIVEKINLDIRKEKIPPYGIRKHLLFFKEGKIYYLIYKNLEFFDLKDKKRKRYINFPYYGDYQDILMDEENNFYLFYLNGLRKVNHNLDLLYFFPWENQGTARGIFLRGGEVIAIFSPKGEVEFVHTLSGKRLGRAKLDGLSFLKWNIPLDQEGEEIVLLDETGTLWELRIE